MRLRQRLYGPQSAVGSFRGRVWNCAPCRPAGIPWSQLKSRPPHANALNIPTRVQKIFRKQRGLRSTACASPGAITVRKMLSINRLIKKASAPAPGRLSRAGSPHPPTNSVDNGAVFRLTAHRYQMNDAAKIDGGDMNDGMILHPRQRLVSYGRCGIKRFERKKRLHLAK